MNEKQIRHKKEDVINEIKNLFSDNDKLKLDTTQIYDSLVKKGICVQRTTLNLYIRELVNVCILDTEIKKVLKSRIMYKVPCFFLYRAF